MALVRKKNNDKSPLVWALLRISIGLIFLWAFFDKLFGLGFTTCLNAKTNTIEVMCDSAVIQGGSATTGFLKFATEGPFSTVYQQLAGNTFIDFIFMAGLLLIGAALVSGIGVKLAAITGSLMLIMMWTAVLPPEHHPFIDDHIVYTIALAGIYLNNSTQRLGLRAWWVRQPVVKRFPILE